MNILVYGGSFDPPHIGHAMVASHALQSGWAQQVWLMPSPQNPLKSDCTSASALQRVEMCRALCNNVRGLEVSDVELNMPLPSYTVRTLEALASRWPQHTFRLLIGSDNWLLFSQWYGCERIISEFGITIYPRPGYEVDPQLLPPNVDLLKEAPQVLISSTWVRNAFLKGYNLNFFVPGEVLHYIEKHRLYGK